MKLSKDTLSIIKNFSTINRNLSLKEGNKLVTMSSGKNIMAEAIVSETFPMDFGIYDLNEFLGVLSLFSSPELEFSAKSVSIKEGANNVKYYAANQSILTSVPEPKPFPTPDIEFNLSGALLSQIHTVSSVLQATDFTVVGDGNTIKVIVGDKSNPTGNTYESTIGDTDKNFSFGYKVENLKMISGDYLVSIGSKKISRFQCVKSQVKYYVALQLGSTFDF